MGGIKGQRWVWWTDGETGSKGREKGEKGGFAGGERSGGK